jgi:hypothetical protein
MPAEDGAHGVLIEAERYRRRGPSLAGSSTEVVLWGQVPLPGASLPVSVLGVLRREFAILKLIKAPPENLRVRHVFRLPPPLLCAGPIRGKLRTALRGGVLVEMSSSKELLRVLDAAVQAAGSMEPVGHLRLGSGGGALIPSRLPDGVPVLIRVGQLRGSGEIERAADALEYLGSSDTKKVPRLLNRGETCGASWSVESQLAGQRPKRLGRDLIGEVARFCWSLPVTDGPPEAPGHDFDVIVRSFPRFAKSLNAMAKMVEAGLTQAPGVMRHGDLWAGNLLIRQGGLTGVVDWDAWHSSGVPGADLLYLTVTEEWLRSRKKLGEIWLRRPWRSQAFTEIAAPYWGRLSIEPAPELLNAVGLSAWASQVASNLARSPQLAFSPRWAHKNVSMVVEGLGY